jgi:hypothetical protein
MDLRTYLSPLGVEARDQFAVKCNTTRGHVQNVMYGIRPCATDLAVLIERESELSVRRWELRAEDWWKHWPELIGTDGAPTIAPTPESTAAKA